MRDISMRGHLHNDLHNGFPAGEVLRPFNIERSLMTLLVSSIVHDSSRDPADLTANGANHIVRRQWPPDPLQLELAHGLDLHGVLDLRQYSRADEDLTRVGLIAKARGNIGYGPDSGIIEPPFKSNGAERGKPVRYADAEANVMPPPTPRFRYGSDCVTHFEGH
jgi:hypothetical protein